MRKLWKKALAGLLVAAVKAKVPFEALASWDFSKLNKAFGGVGIETIGETKYCSGLELVGSVQENKTYLLLGGGKSYHFIDSDGNVIDAAETADTVFLTRSYPVEEGKTYYFYGNGTKPYTCYLGLDY